MQQVGEKVIISFADGELVDAHTIVVGCDGVKGSSRAAVLAPNYADQIAATYSGKYVYRAIVPMQNAIDILGDRAGDGQMFMSKGRCVMAYPISKGAEYNLVFFRDGPWNHSETTHMVTREEMIADFKSCGQHLVKLLQWAKPLQWSLWHHVSITTYYHGNICLLGDSAHATTPHQGAGAGQCLEDALILSRLLGLVDSPC
jgi:salicylate hydroxylase